MGKQSGVYGLEALKDFNPEKMVDDKIVEALNIIGEFALGRSNATHEFDNYSFNLEDSYAYAVYKDGNIITAPVLLDQKAEEPNPEGGKFGRQYSEDYLNEIHPEGSYSLVVCANTPYAMQVEMDQRDVMVSLTRETINKAKSVLNKIKWNKL